MLMRAVQGRLRLPIALTLPAEPAAMIAQHLAAADAPLKVVGRIGEAALGHSLG